MTESPIDLSRPSPPPLIPIRRFRGGLPLPPRRDKDVSTREIDTGIDSQVDSNLGDFRERPSWSCDIEARLGVPVPGVPTEVPTVTTVQANRKVLRVCVNNNSIPPNGEHGNTMPLTESQMSAVLSGGRSRTTILSDSTGKWSWLANLSRSRSVPNVAQSTVEVCPRRKAMSEERVTEGSDEGYETPSKRRRHCESLECSGDSSGSEKAWTNQLCRRSLSGRHVRLGTGAAPATLKGLRDKILSRSRVSAATDVR